MSHVMNEDIERLLDEHVEAARTINEDQLAQATAQFRSVLPAPEPERRSIFSWARVVGGIAALALVVIAAPLLLPGKPGASAFAQAQEWFERYETMNFLMTTRHNDSVVSTVEVWTDHEGNTRVETPPVTILVLPPENVMHTVMPGQPVRSQSLGISPGAFELDNEVEWLGELLEFQGLAEVVESPRDIQGVGALGWELELFGTRHTLWVDPIDHRPLLLEAELGGGVSMESVFIFDEPLPANVFRLPTETPAEIR